MLIRTFSSCVLAIASSILLVLAHPGVSAQAPRFFDDDPLVREPETQDASKVQPWEIDLGFESIVSLFGRPGDRTYMGRALNVSTIDEVPDSSWFTNRIMSRPVTVEELTRGPNTSDGPAPGPLTVIAAKSAGVAPGFTVRDERGEVWFLSFDGAGHPDAATGAIVVATKLFWALGYNQIENYLFRVRLDNLRIDEGASYTPPSGRERPMEQDDLERVLRRAHRSEDGSFRAIAGRGIQGKPLGGFKYYGTRPDDPNDVVPHEHRRELRALKVFGAWTNLIDMKGGNTLDALVSENGRSIVKHYLQDVGSTFGTGALGPHYWYEGHEYIIEGSPTWKRAVSMGFYLSPWQTVPYESVASIGRFEGDEFQPESWKPRLPIAALDLARADDLFWAARRVAAFSDDLIKAAVATGQYSDPAAARLLSEVLIKRRDKIAQVYLTAVTPLVDFKLDSDGTMTFRSAAPAGAAAAPPGGYHVSWFRFDNATGDAQMAGEVTTTEPVARLTNLGTPVPAYLKVDVRAVTAPHPTWEPVTVYFRRSADTWQLVGVQRLAD